MKSCNLKLPIVFNSNGLAIWSGYPDITHNKNIIAILIAMNLAQFQTHKQTKHN